MTQDMLFARCVALSNSPQLGERQLGWAGRWCLMGDFVVCTQCMAAQSIDKAQQRFPHVPDCVAIPSGVHPWYELQRLLSQLPPLPKEHLH